MRRFFIPVVAFLSLVVWGAVPVRASEAPRDRSFTSRSAEREPLSSARANEEGKESESEILGIAREYAGIRTLPAARVSAGALAAARARAAAVPVLGGRWTERTTVPYQNDHPNYRDPVWSNSGAGWGRVAGRIQALAVRGDTLYAGAADGGVWKSVDGGAHWKPRTDDLPSLSSGSLAIDPADGSVWYGTGEATTAFENYLGAGVFRSRDGGRTWRRMGGTELQGTLIGTLAFDGRGHVFAATSGGVYRRPTSGPPPARWISVLRPGTPKPYGFTFANDVAVRPGTRGKVVIASLGWRDASTDYDGFYVSANDGAPGTWRKVRTTGDLRTNQIGRASLAFSGDGSRLYALVESWQYAQSKPSALYGIFASPSGDVAGPWTKVAGWQELLRSHSALNKIYPPGVQSWYNQAIGVDPADPDHVYVGLEEVYESTDGGTTWETIGPYWNFALRCYRSGGSGNCPATPHPDQHAIAFGDGSVYVGDDGGVYSRSLRNHLPAGWRDHNATLRTLQYYDPGVGSTPGGDVIWGGLQDNGVSLLGPGGGPMVSPFGGDGGDVIVDPTNGDRAVVEYAQLDMALTANGGISTGLLPAFREISPSCYAFTYRPNPCDPNPRFIAPFVADPLDRNGHWVAGGRYVWETTKGWNTTCSDVACDWTIVHDTGTSATGIANTTTALAVAGPSTYAAWCADGCNPEGFASGIDTNVGGSWHTVADPSGNGGDPLPQRYVTGLAVDPSNPANVYATFGAYSRRWIQGGGLGHVFESIDAGATWTDVSGNLPDAPVDDVVIVGGNLLLATDIGVFIADRSTPSSWSSLGTGLPHAAVNALAVSPDGTSVVAATHGRGLWSIPLP